MLIIVLNIITVGNIMLVADNLEILVIYQTYLENNF